jgi:hypothetical protein
MTYDNKGNIILCPSLYKRNPDKYQVVTQEQIIENATNGGKRTKTEPKKDNKSL